MIDTYPTLVTTVSLLHQTCALLIRLRLTHVRFAISTPVVILNVVVEAEDNMLVAVNRW
jgi:hypothetical protein